MIITINTSEYNAMSTEEVKRSLEITEDGLSSEEVANRIKKFGYNEIREVKRNLLLEFSKRYWGPMPWLLEISIVLTVILNHYTESIIIFTLLTVNAVIGFLQSSNSHSAVELLKKKLEIKAKVLRNGSWVLTDAREIVPGDILALKLGDLVPADAYLLDGQLSIDQSALTGESLPKSAVQSDVIYSGSVVKRGEAKCAVVNTGENTYFGKTVELVKIAKPKSKQEELMLSIVKYMMYLGIAASVIVSIYAVYLHKDILFILSFIVTLLIAAIPVALPAVLTIVQAAGAMELSKKGVLVAKLDSIEDAASIDIFCFDKTGTITQNKLSVIDCTAFGDYQKEDVIRLAGLASKQEGMDAIDLAVIAYFKAAGLSIDHNMQISYTPFSPESKRTEAVIRDDGKEIRIIKGAVQTILSLCGEMASVITNAANRAVDDYSAKGYRTIAVATSVNDQFNLVGMLAIADPPREDSARMIAELGNLGIKSMMITGDSVEIAQEISKQVGIGSRILRASDLNALDNEKQHKLTLENDGFAGVFPEDKYHIVKLLQESGHMVGMTGDGVNDSPALKQAELGTAVSEATDVAKASASIILTQPGLSEIIDAIVISRKTYQRMLTWVINKITKVVEVAVLFTIGFFWLHNVVISLLGMSLLVFANDFVTMAIATDRVKSTASPNIWNIQTITVSSFLLGLIFVFEDILMIYLGIHLFHLSFEQLQSLVLLTLVFNTQIRMLMVRERKHFWSSAPSRYLLMANIITIIVFALLGMYGIFIPALSATQVFTVLGIIIVLVPMIDMIKYYLFKRFRI